MRTLFLILLLTSLNAVEIAIQGIHLEVEIAATPESRSKGLSGRKTLAEGTGMLFTYEKAEICRFWMKDTLVPLSIAFFDEGKRLIEWKDMPLPGAPKLILVSSSKPALFALEVPLGWFASHKIQPGARFSYIPKKPQ